MQISACIQEQNIDKALELTESMLLHHAEDWSAHQYAANVFKIGGDDIRSILELGFSLSLSPRHSSANIAFASYAEKCGFTEVARKIREICFQNSKRNCSRKSLPSWKKLVLPELEDKTGEI